MSTSERTFGQAFGDLIRERRGQEGITQRQLAISAFNDESKVRRIVELENGQVSRPQTKTVDALRAYFGITQEEMARCLSRPKFSAAEEAKIGLSRPLLENLALRFEHENPDAQDEELHNFLKEKARELQSIRERLAEIERQSTTTADQLHAANVALAQGHFIEADTILASVEELHARERTLVEVRRQAELRSTRGDAALFGGDNVTATTHYSKAAEYLVPFSAPEAAAALEEFAGRIYELERRRPNGQFDGALTLASRALELSDDSDPISKSGRAYRLSLVELNHARTLDNATAISVLEQAEKHAELALHLGADRISDFDWSSARIAQANILLQRGDREGHISGWTSAAADILEELLTSHRTRELSFHRCHLHNNLATALRTLAQTADDAERQKLLSSAHSHLIRAIELSSTEEVPDVWQSAQYNLGSLMAERADQHTGRTADFARLQAIVAFQSAIEMFPADVFANRIASAQLNLGNVLLKHAKSAPERIREVYLVRSIAANESAANIFGQNGAAAEASQAHYSIALAFIAHAEAAEDPVAIADLQVAIEHLETAKRGLKGLESKLTTACQSALEYAETLLSETNRL